MNNEERGRRGVLFQRFPLDTAETARRSFARLIRAYAKGLIDRDLYRDLVYGMAAYTQAIKTTRDDDLEKRISNLEGALNGNERPIQTRRGA